MAIGLDVRGFAAPLTNPAILLRSALNPVSAWKERGYQELPKHGPQQLVERGSRCLVLPSGSPWATLQIWT